MKLTLTLPDWIAKEIRLATTNPLETAGVLLASMFSHENGNVKLLGREMHWVPDGAYLKRESDSMLISSTGYVPALKRAEDLGSIAIWFHTHPAGVSPPISSNCDDIVNAELSELFKYRTGSNIYSALIASPSNTSFSFTGFIELENGTRNPIEKILTVGDFFQLTESYAAKEISIDARFDRNVRALGGGIQNSISKLRVGIVGCGGTGSCVSEMLARLGVIEFFLIDPDTLSESNLTRVYGSKENDVGRLKAKIARDNLMNISSKITCEIATTSILNENSARLLTTCDFIFGCTDDNAGRLILSKISSYFLIPVIDCGVLVSADANDSISGIDGRITTLTPGCACLVCRGRIDLRQAAAEMLSPGERKKLENEGYAPALGRIEPAVVSFTTAVAAAAVSEFLERFIGYGPDPRPSEVLLRIHDREISTNIVRSRPGHYCDRGAGKIGRGMTKPFLDQVWQT